ncbi:methyltransferase [bacterium]|nr:methyltransferase [bacterium]
MSRRKHTISDLPSLISQLAQEDNEIAKDAGDAILSVGVLATTSLLEATPIAPTHAKRRLVFLLGEIARREDADPRKIGQVLANSLSDEDWKVRKNAAVSLGKAKQRSTLQAVKQRLEVESDPRVRVSLILSLGHLVGAADTDALNNIILTTESEKSAAQKVTDKLLSMREDTPKIDVETAILPAVECELWCRKGVAEILKSECIYRHIDAEIITSDRVRVAGVLSINQLLNIRTALFPVLAIEMTGDFADPYHLGRLFVKTDVASEMRRITEGTEVTYRLTFDIVNFPRKRRIEWIERFTAGAQGLINRATGYSWDIIVKSTPNTLLFGVRPANVSDNRFSYRKSTIPAALHPTLAAAAAQLVPGKADDIVVDPFCGSGTLLAERAVSAPYARMEGFDINPQAFQAAHANLEGFKEIFLRKTSFKTLSKIKDVSLIITNPPYGQRVSNREHARSMQFDLDALASTALKDGGYLIVFRPPNFPSPSDLKVLKRIRIDAAGLQVDLVVAQKGV